MLAVDPVVPTFIANPFRAPGSGELVPLTGLERPDIDCTLLRRAPSPPAVSDEPLFQAASDYVQPENNDAHDDARRNAYFRLQGLHRLGNMVTTRSNVYAIWITVGFFELTPSDADGDGTPESLQVSREHGVMTGDVKRHRAFYIVDRSIPVAYEPGENHNVDRAILVRRLIE